MSLRQPLSKILSSNRPPMRLDTFRSTSWASSSVSKLRRNVSSSRQVFLVTSQDKSRELGNGPHSSAAAELSTLASIGPSSERINNAAKIDGSRFRSAGNVAFKENNAPDVHLAPKPQRISPPPPPLADKPSAAGGDGFFHSRASQRPDFRGLPLRDRLQIARRRRPYQNFRDPGAAKNPSSSSPSSFDLIVANRLANAPPPPPKETTDTFSPLVKAIFDLLDQAPPVEQPPKPATELELDNATAAATTSQAHQTYYHRQRHKYRVYQQAFNTGDPRFDSLGRTLCRILRHQATQLSLPIRSNGYVKVDDILRLTIRTHAGIPMNEHSVEEVLRVVERDPKQRYSTMVEGGELFIRANQGHSMKVVASDALLTEITSADQVPVCVHGTFRCFLPSIMRTGLNRMSRNHVHFAIGLPNEEGVISGMMDSVEVLIYLNVAKALQDDMKLYISDNKVLLTEGFAGVVPCEYFEKVVEWPTFTVIA
ncbi:uncharacterized protein LOC9630666 [Selaginella moellendorffii]|nr:uncharacterized protein LOC9630666 [Selaginella moellendorffii]|eukprot:XP_002962094.2 uncharacterized protein LOC9630666 [Selaginella moellendorffii]